MKRYPMFILVLIAFPSMAQAEPAIPSWCCPNACQIVEGSTMLDSSNGPGGLSASAVDGRELPFSENLYRGETRDGLTRICVGFNAFGDPEIKCVLSPPPLT